MAIVKPCIDLSPAGPAKTDLCPLGDLLGLDRRLLVTDAREEGAGGGGGGCVGGGGGGLFDPGGDGEVDSESGVVLGAE